MTGGDDFEDQVETLIKRGMLPTFDQFKNNPQKWRENKEALFEAIDRSMLDDRKNLARQKIFWRDGKESFKLEKLERVCKENGYEINQVEIIPFRMKNSSGTGKDEIYVRVYPKHEVAKMGGVVANA